MQEKGIKRTTFCWANEGLNPTTFFAVQMVRHLLHKIKIKLDLMDLTPSHGEGKKTLKLLEYLSSVIIVNMQLLSILF